MSNIYGLVTFEVCGTNISRFISRCACRGIRLHTVCGVTGREKPSVVVSADARDAKSVMLIARECSLRVRSIKRRGLPFIIRAALGRYVLLFGGILAVCATFVLSQFIWVIEIKGTDGIPEERIYELLSDAGIHVAMPKDRFFINEVIHGIHAEDERIAHISAGISGVKMTVTVQEAVTPAPKDEGEYGALYADADGVIEEILCYSGHACVKKGDVVHKGDVLITGDISTESREIRVAAKGKVTAKVGYVFIGTAEERLPAKVRSGKSRELCEIEFFGKRLVKGVYDDYEKEYSDETEKTDTLIPLTLRRVTEFELTDGYRRATDDEQKNAARERAQASMQRGLDKDARVLSKETAYERDESGKMTAIISIIALREIAVGG